MRKDPSIFFWKKGRVFEVDYNNDQYVVPQTFTKPSINTELSSQFLLGFTFVCLNQTFAQNLKGSAIGFMNFIWGKLIFRTDEYNY